MGFVHHLSPRRVPEAPYLRVYRCHTLATVLGSHQHPKRGTQQVAGAWQGEELAGAPNGPEMWQDQSWDAADNTVGWLLS